MIRSQWITAVLTHSRTQVVVLHFAFKGVCGIKKWGKRPKRVIARAMYEVRWWH